MSDFWGRNMKTFLWKSSQRPLIRSGSEWPLYLGLGRMKAFLAREGEREILCTFVTCTTTAMSTRLDILNQVQLETTSCSVRNIYVLPSNPIQMSEDAVLNPISAKGAVMGH